MHTRTTTFACGCAQPQHGEGQKASHGHGRHRQRIFRATRDVRAHLTRPRSRLCPPRASAQQRPFCQLYCQHAATALPCLPRHTPLRCSLLCRGRALLLRLIQVASRSQCPPGPPGRLACDVCVCNVLFLCWLVCRLGFDRVGSRLLVGCFCFRLRLLCPPPIPSHHITSCTQHTPHASHTHHLHLHASRTLHAVHLTHTALTTHLPDITPPTPRTSHTHHIHTTPHPFTTHHIHHAPHPPH